MNHPNKGGIFLRRPIIAGNWKMHKTVEESVVFLDELKEKSLPEEVEAVLCAPFLSLPALVEEAKGQKIAIGAQNVHQETEGAYTGEVSVPMLQAVGVSYVILGHSERRADFAETDEQVNQKVQAVLAGELIPIVCVGEQLAERTKGQTADVVRKQVTAAFQGLTAEQAKKVVVAYEPVWAIGTGKAATAEDAEEVCSVIRTLLTNLYDASIAEEIRILYGGSVKPSNIASLIAKPNIDGALVGGASLEVDSYLQLLQGAKGS